MEWRSLCSTNDFTLINKLKIISNGADQQIIHDSLILSRDIFDTVAFVYDFMNSELACHE